MLKAHPTAFKSSFEEEAARPLEAFAERIPADGVDVLFGAYAGGVVSGSAGFSREPRAKTAHKGVLSSVYVRPELRGRGLGEALVRRVIKHARAHVDLLQCSVITENIVAGALYRRLGFADYGVEPRALRVDSRDYDETLMVLTLR